MTPAIVKFGYAIQLDNFNEDKEIKRLFDRLRDEFDDVLGRFRTDNYNELSSSTHGNIAKHLTDWISYSIRPGNTVPDLVERSGREGFTIDKIVSVTIINGDTNRDEFQASILVATESLTLVGQTGDTLLYAYGDVTSELKARKPITLYQIESSKVTWFEEYQLIQL